MSLQRPLTPPRQAASASMNHPLTTPTSSQSLLTRLLHTQVPRYQQPPSVALTELQQGFFSAGFSALPPAIDPTATPCTDAHNSSRYTRKREHITAILRHLLPILRPERGRLVDACCGTGHVGLVLACLLPTWDVVLLDRSSLALNIVRKRAEEARLSNVTTVEGCVEGFTEPFDALVALHACGGASDACLSAILRNNAVGLVIPCCTGGSVTQRGRVTGMSYDARVIDPHPRAAATNGDEAFVDWGRARSEAFRQVLGENEFEELARCADGIEGMGRVAKTLMEHDRLLWLRESGFSAGLGRLGGGVKDDVLIVGDTTEWRADEVGNGGVEDFLCWDGEGVDSVLQVLKNVVVDGGGVYRARGGRVVRKSVHAAAEVLGLRHVSTGKGRDRVVVVSRDGDCDSDRDGEGRGKLFFKGYVGVTSESIEQLAAGLCEFVPEEMLNRRVEIRGTSFHVTLLAPGEVRAVGDRHAIVNEAKCLQGTEIMVRGVGRVAQEEQLLHGWDGRPVEVPGTGNVREEAYFVVLEWPAAQKLRRRYGLPEADFHITLGFRDHDVHNLRKDAGTIFHAYERSFIWDQ